MRQVTAACAVFALTSLAPVLSFAQSPQSDQNASVPRVVTITGTFRPADGRPAGSVEVATFSIYGDERSTTPLWQERQSVSIDEKGHYTVLLGLTQVDGVPAKVFESGAQWLGTIFERAGEVEGPRVRITSVPYALRASDAETLGGRPASAYLLAPSGAGTTEAPTPQAQEVTTGTSQSVVLTGTPNFLAKYVNSADVGNSAVVESGGSVGIGTSTPLDTLHVRFLNTNGAATGLAVQNLGSTATSYSGMLFYDQNGTLGQFQGFNNSTHEYRINNIGRNGSSQFDGSINFMIGSTSRFLVGSNGNIGIGTTTPTNSLEVSNGLSTNAFGSVLATTYAATSQGSGFFARKARGTLAAPTAVQSGDTLGLFAAGGYGATHFGALNTGAIGIRATENWTDSAQGTSMNFSVTPTGSTTPFVALTVTSSGNIGVGTASPAGAMEIVRQGSADILTTGFNGSTSSIVTRSARGLAATPSATLFGDFLGVFGGGGYDGTSFSLALAGMAPIAAEDWSSTAHGTALIFGTTPVGTTQIQAQLGILDSGNVGIGTPLGAAGDPTATDKLQVYGDIRVGTNVSDGCVKNFAGTAIAGTCSSDRRFKKDIMPFAPVLSRLTALQPVHYYWRAADFPERHFGNARTYGLVAQDVEQVLPELVVTNPDGYKAVDYSELPLLTIQAVKELKAENEALKQQVTLLKSLEQRVAELEKLLRNR
jgi:hypothetical protein